MFPFTAIHGISFFPGGKKAFRLLTENSLNVATINCVGDFVLVLGKLFVVITSVLITNIILKVSRQCNG
jgi:solute carrier family 44 protein 1 (choline transporter-like protein)